MNDSTATSKGQVIPFQFRATEVRIITIDNNPWFCLRDMCDVLDLDKNRSLNRFRFNTEGVAQYATPSAGGAQDMYYINEGNVFRLITRSKKPEALHLERWIFDEVLPAIRKHGHYRDAEGKMGTLIGQTIGTDGFHCLAAVVEGRLRRYPKATQQRARSHLWSQVRKAFGVSRGEDIPASQLDAARQFIAAYALEGEWLPASPCTTVDAPPLLPDTPDEADYVNLKSLCHHMLQIRDIYRHYHLYDALTQLGSPAGKRLYGHVVDGAAIAQRYQPKLQQRLH
ncbi:BRO family protein [Halomonas sp.]|uniref:BRO-N domain-containing protein n=1 Tax=Halomonas sp. TaxID=1486246 RepID=UPI003F933822